MTLTDPFVTNPHTEAAAIAEAVQAQPNLKTAASRERQRRRNNAEQVENWRIRGHIAATIGAERRAPPLTRSTAPTVAAAKHAAWLAGYDAASRRRASAIPAGDGASHE